MHGFRTFSPVQEAAYTVYRIVTDMTDSQSLTDCH